MTTLATHKYATLVFFLPQKSKLRAWVQASRPIGQLQLALPVALGQAFAYAATGVFSLKACLWLHAFAAIDGLFISFANDVADAETDAANDTFQTFSGGSRVIAEGKLTKRALAVAALIAMTALSVLAAVAAPARPLVPLFTLAAIALMHAYSYAPLKLSYRGHGEVLQALGVGLLLPVLAWYVQLGSLRSFPWLTLIPLALFAYAGNIAGALSDTPSDRAHAKRTYPVRCGEAQARRDVLVLLAAGIVIAAVLAPSPFVVAPAVLVLAIAVRLRHVAAPANRAECKRFIVACATVVNCVICWWFSALVFIRGMAL